MQTLISWNVASIRARLPALLKLLEQERPDIVCLQEIKATKDTFPFEALKEAGYEAAINGQKSWNGVALLSREPFQEVHITLPTLSTHEPEQARFIEGVLPNGMHVISVYVPNGNPPLNNPQDTTRLTYKLQWMHALEEHLKERHRRHQPVIIGGDFNVIERDSDVYNPDLFRNNAVMLPSVRAAFQAYTQIPMTNAIRLIYPTERLYSFWDFQGGAWPKNMGMMLDYFLASSDLTPHIRTAGIFEGVRGWNKTSDHAPIFCVLD